MGEAQLEPQGIEESHEAAGGAGQAGDQDVLLGHPQDWRAGVEQLDGRVPIREGAHVMTLVCICIAGVGGME